MRIRSIMIFGLAGTLMISACSTATEEKPQSQVDNAAGSNANTVAVANGADIAPPKTADANVNGVAAATSDSLKPGGDTLHDRMENLRKTGGSGPPVDVEQLASKNARPAPDNSTFTSYLTDAGYEIRVFKNHPQLLKVEKKVTSDGKNSMKIFLRNGKVVELPGNRIMPLATAPASSILEAAGVQAPSPPAPSGPAPTKKSG